MLDHEEIIKKLGFEITYNDHRKALFYNATIHYIYFKKKNENREYIYSSSNRGSYVLSYTENDNGQYIICYTQNYQKMKTALENLEV